MQRDSYIKCDLSIQSLFVTTACEVNNTPLICFTETAIGHADKTLTLCSSEACGVRHSKVLCCHKVQCLPEDSILEWLGIWKYCVKSGAQQNAALL